MLCHNKGSRGSDPDPVFFGGRSVSGYFFGRSEPNPIFSWRSDLDPGKGYQPHFFNILDFFANTTASDYLFKAYNNA